MIASWDHNGLFDKARVFLNRAMDDNPERSFDERAFWASTALELLGKAALSKHSPTLIADPTGDGRAVLVASGLVQGDATFVSVAAKTVFVRCAIAFRPFSSKEATEFAQERNEYVHGAGIGFIHFPPDIWWPRYFAQVSILVEALGRTFADLVGPDRVAQVEAHLERNAHNVAHRVESLIERARRNLALSQSGQMSTAMEREWRAPRDLALGLEHATVVVCPACGADGRLEAADYEDDDYEYEYDEDERPIRRWLIATANAEYFSCPRCRLVLDRYELLVQAGVPDTFDITIDEPDDEPDYGND